MSRPWSKLIAALDWRVPVRPVSDVTPLASEYGHSAVSRRRVANLAVFLLVGSAAAVMGYLPWQVPLVLLPWIAGVGVATTAIARAESPQHAQWIETVSYCFDAVLLTVVCFYVGGAHWIASAFYVLLVITAAASLPMPRAVLIAVVAWLGFAFLSIGQAVGALEIPPFGAAPANRVPLAYAALTVVIQGTTLMLALLLQQSLLGALRRSEARHRAILRAASDMVVVLDCDGVVQGASEVFADRTAFPIRALVGSPFAEIVDAEHQEEWRKGLRTACTGDHAPFEVAYRSRQANRGWIAGTLVPLPPERGRERVLMIARDVSSERRGGSPRGRVARTAMAG